MTNPESIPKKARKRSAAYPAFNLEEVIEATRTLKDKLGDGPYSREHMAIALGYKGITGSSSMKIASCVHFGLLDRNGNTYIQSSLANRYFYHISEEEREQILVEAFSSPTLYQKLIAEYNGKSLPQMLESIFIRNYGIQENAARGAVISFRESAEFVGVLKNGVLDIDVDGTNSDIQPQKEPGNTVGEAPSSTLVHSGTLANQPSNAGTTSDHLSVMLPSGLVVGYSQELASAFAFGVFAQKLKELDNAIAEHKKTLADKADNTEDAYTDQDRDGTLA